MRIQRHRSTTRLAAAIDGLLEETTRRVAREIAGDQKKLLRTPRAEALTELRRLDRRLTKLERQASRAGTRGNGPAKRTARCKRDGCREPALARGLCSRHYQQMRYRKKHRKRTGHLG
ncbi:MAG: hypothetical protein V3T05_00725 [Myxococcota bacterium]